jgi:hypothetical protein
MSTQDNFMKASSTEKVGRNLQMEMYTVEDIQKESLMAMASIFGPMEVSTKASLRMGLNKAKGSTILRKEGVMKVTIT